MKMKVRNTLMCMSCVLVLASTQHYMPSTLYSQIIPCSLVYQDIHTLIHVSDIDTDTDTPCTTHNLSHSLIHTISLSHTHTHSLSLSLTYTRNLNIRSGNGGV